jgi:predicted nucleotide-binding protein (sugar kinase/HSP70/actin superfamily)
MSDEGTRAFAAAFRYLGIEAYPSPDGDERTYEIAGRFTSGDECLPERVTIGDFLKVTEQPDFDPAKTAFFMPTASGPCRFGQYSPFLKQVLHELGYDDILIVSPTSADGYSSLGEYAGPMMRLGWWGLVGSDAVRKMLHIYRPHETQRGAADRACDRALGIFCDALADSSVPIGAKKLDQLAGALERGRDLFRAIPVDFSRETKLIGVVGEIFCRLSTFSNEDLIRQLETFGAQAWLSDISEWVWYTNLEQEKNLRLYGRALSLEMLKVKIKERVQHAHEARLLAPFREEFVGLEEPHSIMDVLNRSYPYLPYHGSLGEMVLSVGKAVYLYEKGVDGIIDISPFTCMNGIICESIYPKVSRDCDGMPIRTFYFDGTQTDLENDLGIFMELVSNYSRRKTKRRLFRRRFANARV